jgi:TolB-like protein/class 3 adenylate cyclase/Tfp pilus assembly protein PilF
MPTPDAKRKPTTILIADVKGYSLLLGEDEAYAIQALNTNKEFIVSIIQEHKGRLVESVGDNLLVEFPNAVEAVQSAVKIQKELKIRNAQLAANRRMEFRIGINLGDVIEEGEKISGDGINVTAKLESLAAPGGICISGSAYDYVKNKLALGFEYLGEQNVKNIEKPVRVYRVLVEPRGIVSRLSIWKGAAVRQWERLNPAVKVIIAVVAVANGIWQVYPMFFDSPPTLLSKKLGQQSSMEVASKDKMALPLPDIPSIAVLPFANLSEDQKQDFLGDGITGNIITSLSKTPNLLVIDRNSTFTYKGKPVKVKQVSEELGVQYVLEGTIQKSADRVRITAQLIDALTGHHIWAEKYDRDLTDVFSLQDEITMKIMRAVQVKVTAGELSPQGKYYKGRQGFDCYLKLVEGAYYQGRQTVEDTNMARRLAEEAMALCLEAPGPYSLLAWVNLNDYWLGSTKSPQESLDKAIELMQKAVAMDDNNAEFHGSLSRFYAINREYDKAVAEGERAMALNPGGALVLTYYGGALIAACKPEEAIPLLQKAIRLNPKGLAYYFQQLGEALRMAGRLEEAVSVLKKAIQRQPTLIWPHLFLAATYSLMGKEKEAREEAEEVLRINPRFSLAYLAKVHKYKDQLETEELFNALSKAGLR